MELILIIRKISFKFRLKKVKEIQIVKFVSTSKVTRSHTRTSWREVTYRIKSRGIRLSPWATPNLLRVDANDDRLRAYTEEGSKPLRRGIVKSKVASLSGLQILVIKGIIGTNVFYSYRTPFSLLLFGILGSLPWEELPFVVVFSKEMFRRC